MNFFLDFFFFLLKIKPRFTLNAIAFYGGDCMEPTAGLVRKLMYDFTCL